MYAIILDPGTIKNSFVTDSHGFIEWYNTFEDANEIGKEYLDNGDCQEYVIIQEVKS